MSQESVLTALDKKVIDIIEEACVQYEKYLELNKLDNLSELFNKQAQIAKHDWDTPLDIVYK